jgi:hypothetical protein
MSAVSKQTRKSGKPNGLMPVRNALALVAIAAFSGILMGQHMRQKNCLIYVNAEKKTDALDVVPRCPWNKTPKKSKKDQSQPPFVQPVDGERINLTFAHE